MENQAHRRKVNWLRVVAILGSGAGLIYFLIKLSESNIVWLLP